jgi:hypothetical protein
VEGSLFFSSERPKRTPDLVCRDCGSLFRPRRVTDGVEELCDSCYEMRFPSNQTLFEPNLHPEKRDLAAD